MVAERKAWERLPDEPNRWYARFDQFRLMGSGRSLLALYRSEREKAGKGGIVRRVPGSWDQAAERFRWRERAETWDEAERQRMQSEQAAYRRAIMESGFALDFERVKALKELAQRLIVELLFGGRLWLTDKKQLGGGELATVVDIERFNAAEVEQLRGVFDDIAKEKGERKTVVDLNVIRKEAQRLAEELGLDAADVIAEAERIAAGRA